MGAIGDAYVTAAQIVTRTGQADDGTFDEIALAASRLVERYTKRQFNKTDTATARRFVAADRCRLPVDDFHSVTNLAVTVNDVEIDIDTVDPRPWDGVINGQPGWPFFDLFRTTGSWPLGRRARVSVTAKWGWTAVPDAIFLATLDAGAELVAMSKNGAIGPIRSEAIDGYSVSFLNEMFDGNVSLRNYMRDAYRRKTFGVA